MESLGVGTTSSYLPFLLRDQTQPGLISREKEEAANKVWSPWASGQLPHPYSSLLRDQTQPGLFSREKEDVGNKVWSPWVSGQLPHASPPCCVTRINKVFSFARKKKQGTKFGVPWRRDNFSTLLFPASWPDSTRVIFSSEGRSREQSLESLGVGTTSPLLPSFLRDQTQPGLFSREKEEAENKVWSPRASGQLTHLSSPCCVTRLNQGLSLVRRKKQGTKFEVPGRLDNFHTFPNPAA